MITVKGREIKEKLFDTFDYSYSVSTHTIDFFEEFMEQIYYPFAKKEKIYYRGERINSKKRFLIPSLLRNGGCFRAESQTDVTYLNRETLFAFYTKQSNFINVFKTVNGNLSENSMYEMLAFAQHYLKLSPFIDFTKSLYVALSFALKGREAFHDDIVLYTVVDVDDDDTSDDIEEVNGWINHYNVAVVDTERNAFLKSALTENMLLHPGSLLKDKSQRIHKPQPVKIGDIINQMYPQAKLIDIPTNDLMKYQQGVFLLLNNFTLISSRYLTKSVRQSFILKKYVISKSVCPELNDLIMAEAPHYRYEYLLDISKAVK